ncbi:MAG TPA: ABC transporter substrate-binding protein, partial [Tepidiformaceae bacterium]|nr:ABC transporter substrate-binding protein [Tepidiformaceae bacterium]
AAAAAAANMVQRYDHQNAPALQRLIAGGTQLRRFSDEILRAAQTAAHEIAEENATKDAAYRRIYEHWKAFREDAFRWFGTTELAYQNFAFGEKRG